MSQDHEMFIPLDMNYDKTLLYQCVKENFSKINLWTKISNYQKPKHYWLEIRGHEVGEHIIIKKTLRMIQDCVNPNTVAFHQLPGAGAKFVMLGGLISGAIENNNKVSINGRDYINFYGLGSKKQFELSHISEKDHRSVEGRDLLVPCDISILDHFKRIKNALRSACAYLGVDHIKDLQKKAEFIRVSDQLNSSLAKYENESK